ncbi:PqiC family protein [Quatrionicoccus australiensis]|uniref:PqiC family protein n=1 Tax=Quatrionicoccus australiensis TaxID=138118 RepID=UPI001CFAC2E1|nr:PqiC family protein [Quatrionicoccus australiensis]MCB4361615.1 membrane integrity-associated transporter subunit PqiC [Quatrionicoccus australiensis]
MNRFLSWGLLTACGLGLAGCASSPVHYYTLMAPASASSAPNKPPVAFRLEVLPVGMPVLIDRQALVVRQGENGVAILDSERWTAPFSDELRDALSSNLARKLATQDLAGLPRAKGGRVLRVKLQVRRLDAWLGQQVQLEADWTLSFAGDTTNSPLTCRAQFDVAAPGSYPQLVSAQQHAITLLAEGIAADARNFADSPRTACSTP